MHEKEIQIASECGYEPLLIDSNAKYVKYLETAKKVWTAFNSSNISKEDIAKLKQSTSQTIEKPKKKVVKKSKLNQNPTQRKISKSIIKEKARTEVPPPEDATPKSPVGETAPNLVFSPIKFQDDTPV